PKAAPKARSTNTLKLRFTDDRANDRWRFEACQASATLESWRGAIETVGQGVEAPNIEIQEPERTRIQAATHHFLSEPRPTLAASWSLGFGTYLELVILELGALRPSLPTDLGAPGA